MTRERCATDLRLQHAALELAIEFHPIGDQKNLREKGRKRPARRRHNRVLSANVRRIGLIDGMKAQGRRSLVL